MQPTRGFTLVEMLLAMTIAVCVMGAVVSFIGPAQAMFAAQPEVSDMQQRLRVAVDALQKDLMMAGAGITSGPLAGPLVTAFAAILPYRVGDSKPDPPGSFFTDRLTTIAATPAAAQGSLAVAMANPSPVAGGTTSCVLKADAGFKEGMVVVVMDGTAAWDAFKVTDARGPLLQLRRLTGVGARVYQAGSAIAQVAIRTYWLKTDAATDPFQLMRYDGASSDVPLTDNVVALAFEYDGDALPPQLRPTVPVSTTYGAKPPPIDLDDEADSWGAGENCLFARADGGQASRLASLGDGGLVRLSAAQLTDGPWCPDASAEGRYDADLLRIRRVRAVLRVQAADVFRGRAGPLFMRSGTARSGERFLPDREIAFDVTPRNLNLSR